MAERDNTPTKVTLTKQRPYRLQDSDRSAVWVGPGEADVPRWVAEHWGMVESDTKQNPQIPADAVSATVETVETVEQPEADSDDATTRRGKRK